MSLLCQFGRHTPSIASIMHDKHGGYHALCDRCGTPIVRADTRNWRAAPPLVDRATSQ